MNDNDLVLSNIDYHGKFCIAELYRGAIVAPIIERQTLDINPDEILCIVDDASTSVTTSCAKICVMPEIITDIMYQLTGRKYCLMLKLSQSYLRNLNPERITYYVYDALRHVCRNEKGKYIINPEHDIQIWDEILPYLRDRKELPDFSEVRVYEVAESSDRTSSESVIECNG